MLKLAIGLPFPARITAGAVQAAHVLTTIKIWAFGASAIQLVALVVVMLVSRR